jgi:L-threonylcarbamoyladenylate synthase
MTRSNINVNIDDDFDGAIELASKLFNEGKIFIYPTDTVYGIGGNPFHEFVVRRIQTLKQREEFKQFIFLIDNIERLKNFIELSSNQQYYFLKKIWPGPVTVILKANPSTSGKLNIKSLAFRIPDNKFCLSLLERIKMPLISTSVNKKDEAALTNIADIKSVFASEVDAFFFSEEKQGGLPSTIIDLTTEKPKLMREGSIKFVELLAKFS